MHNPMNLYKQYCCWMAEINILTKIQKCINMFNVRKWILTKTFQFESYTKKKNCLVDEVLNMERKHKLYISDKN